MGSRVILHVDMDAFFAAIEVLDRPQLRGKPLIVGGGVKRGVVSTASYEARKFGIHSAMPMAQALRLCPQVVVVQGHMSRYREMSRRIMAILGTYTPLLEQVSVDEAYLDMTQWLPLGSSGEQIAGDIQRQILAETGLTCSIGVASGKAIAKMASDLRKPQGLVVVPEGEEAEFLAGLPIGKLRGVGEATERKLRALGVRTIADLTRLPVSLLERKFGVHGRELLALAQGRDESPIVTERKAKSLGREVTFLQDVIDREVLECTLLELADDIAEGLRRHELLASGVTLKLRYDDFTTFTRAHTLPEPVDVTGPLYQQGIALLRESKLAHPIRLIGITAGPLLPRTQRQLSLFSEPSSEREQKLDAAIDSVRSRFGANSIIRARLAKGPEERQAPEEE